MLAQSFKTATQLDLRQVQYDALMKTLVWFETDKVTHEKIHFTANWYSSWEERPLTTEKFNLSVWISEVDDCGTIACIGGTAEIIGKCSFQHWEHNRRLSALFNPRKIGSLEKVTVQQAAHALRNYLTTGCASWHKVMKPGA